MYVKVCIFLHTTQHSHTLHLASVLCRQILPEFIDIMEPKLNQSGTHEQGLGKSAQHIISDYLINRYIIQSNR